MDINRMTTIPMPHRGKKAILRTRAKHSIIKADPVPKSKFALMTPIDILKWGLDYKRNVKKGWLKNLLCLLLPAVYVPVFPFIAALFLIL